MTSKLFENITLQIARRYTEESNCPGENDVQRNSQFIRNMTAVPVFWNIDKAFDITCTLVCCTNCQNYNFLSVQLYLFSFAVKKKIQYFGGRKKSTRGLFTTAFRPDSSLVLSVPKRYPPDIRYIYSSLCRWYLNHATGRREGYFLRNYSATYRGGDVM